MSVMGIIVLLIIILFAFLGLKKGLVRKISGILSILISCALVNFLLPQVTVILKERTPVYSFVNDRCQDLVNAQVSRLLPENVSLTDLSRTQQTTLIRSLPIPEFLQKMMESYNNSEGYRKLEAFDFAQYLVRFISNLIMNILAFAATMLIVFLIVRLIIGSLHLFSGLPLLGALDRIGGLLCGALEGIFVVWFLLMILSLLSGTDAGMRVQEQIDRSITLWPVAEANVFMRIIRNALSQLL